MTITLNSPKPGDGLSHEVAANIAILRLHKKFGKPSLYFERAVRRAFKSAYSIKSFSTQGKLISEPVIVSLHQKVIQVERLAVYRYRFNLLVKII